MLSAIYDVKKGLNNFIINLATYLLLSFSERAILAFIVQPTTAFYPEVNIILLD